MRVNYLQAGVKCSTKSDEYEFINSKSNKHIVYQHNRNRIPYKTQTEFFEAIKNYLLNSGQEIYIFGFGNKQKLVKILNHEMKSYHYLGKKKLRYLLNKFLPDYELGEKESNTQYLIVPKTNLSRIIEKLK